MSAPAAAPIVESDAVVTPTVAAVEAEVVAEPTEATAVEPAAAPAVAQPAPAAAQHEAKKFLLKHKEKLKMNQYWYSLPTIAAMVTEAERESKRACFLSTPSIFFSLNDKTLQANSKVFDYDEMWAKHPGFVKYDYKKADEIPKELHHTFDFIVIDPPFITAEVWADYAKAAKMLLVEGQEDVELDSALADSYYASLVRGHAAGVLSAKGDVSGTSFAGNIASMLSSAFGGGSSPAAAAAATAPVAPTPPRPAATEGRSIMSVPRGKLLLSTIPEHEGYLYALLGCYQPRFRPSIPNLIYQYSLYINYPSAPLQSLNPEIDDAEPEDKKFTSKKKSQIAF